MNLADQLHRAIHAGLLNEVKRLVEEGASMDRMLGMRGTALCAAIETRNLEITKFLLDAGCDVNAADFDGEPPLLLALRKDKPGHIMGRTPSLDIATVLMENEKCNVNKVDPLTKKSAIHFASEEGMVKAVKCLMTAPMTCNINAVDVNGNTPLHLAVGQGHHEMVDALVSNPKCLLKVYNKAGLTPMHICSNNGAVKSLTILLKRLETSKVEDVDGNYENELSANVNAFTIFEKETCLQLAVRNEFVGIVKILLEHSARVNEENLLNNTALLLSIVSVKQWQNMNNEIPKMLLKMGADPNVKSTLRCRYVKRDTEVSPLILAALNNNLELATLFIESGADVNMPDNVGRTPVHVALWENSQSVAWYFLKECVGINVNLQTDDGATCMHAVLKCHSEGKPEVLTEIIDAIFKAGGKMVPNKAGKTPVDYAFDYENHVALDAFLEKSDSFEIVSKHNVRSLWFTISEGLIDMMKVLLAHGADINKSDDVDESNLYIALYKSEYKIAEFLVQNGFDLRNESYVFEKCESNKAKLNAQQDNGENSGEDEGESSDEYTDSDDSENFDVFRGNERLREWMQNVASSPRTLELSCLLTVRKYFRDENIPFRKMNCLPLPDKLQNKLRYREGYRQGAPL